MFHTRCWIGATVLAFLFCKCCFFSCCIFIRAACEKSLGRKGLELTRKFDGRISEFLLVAVSSYTEHCWQAVNARNQVTTNHKTNWQRRRVETEGSVTAT